MLDATKLGGKPRSTSLPGDGLISYWNYGDFSPISHHCSAPERRPVKGFEWINSTQGGKNSLIYGIPTNIETPEEGFNIYRVRYDGAQMELMENVSETTGLGLGVHVTIDPKNADRYFVTDGQKDIAACFDRRTSRVIAALKYDWVPNVRNLAEGWQKGGVLKISKIYPDPATGKYDYRGTKGQKIEWEMVPMGELFVEEGTIPGTTCTASAADGTIWHPTGPLGVHRDKTMRRPAHSRCREEFRAGGVPAIQQGRAEPVPGQQDRQRSLGGEVRQGLLARPRGRLLAGRPVPVHDEQSAREQLLDLRFERSRSAQVEKARACGGSAVARQVSEPVPHGFFHGQLEALSFDPASIAGHQRRHGGRHQDLDDQEGDPGHRAGHADLGDLRDGKYVVGVFSGFQRLSSGIATSTPRPTSWSASGHKQRRSPRLCGSFDQARAHEAHASCTL